MLLDWLLWYSVTGSSKSGKDDSNNRTSHQASGSSAIVSDANQTTVNSNSTAGAATSIIQTPIDADRVIAHFEQQQHPASGKLNKCFSISCSFSCGMLQLFLFPT